MINAWLWHPGAFVCAHMSKKKTDTLWHGQIFGSLHRPLPSSSSSSSSSTNFIATQVLNKTSWPLCVTYYTTAVMSMLLWPIVCVAVWSAEQFRLQCTLERPQRRQRRDRRWQRIPNLCRGDGEGAIADGPVQRPWNMQRRWRCRSQTPTWLDVGDPL